MNLSPDSEPIRRLLVQAEAAIAAAVALAVVLGVGAELAASAGAFAAAVLLLVAEAARTKVWSPASHREALARAAGQPQK